MKKIIITFVVLAAVATSTHALFLDGPRSKCGPVSNAACGK